MRAFCRCPCTFVIAHVSGPTCDHHAGVEAISGVSVSQCTVQDYRTAFFLISRVRGRMLGTITPYFLPWMIRSVRALCWASLPVPPSRAPRQIVKGPIRATTAFGAPGVRFKSKKRVGTADANGGAGGDEFLVRLPLAETKHCARGIGSAPPIEKNARRGNNLECSLTPYYRLDVFRAHSKQGSVLCIFCVGKF